MISNNKFFVAINNEEDSRDVQKALFEKGYQWANGGKSIMSTVNSLYI